MPPIHERARIRYVLKNRQAFVCIARVQHISHANRPLGRIIRNVSLCVTPPNCQTIVCACLAGAFAFYRFSLNLLKQNTCPDVHDVDTTHHIHIYYIYMCTFLRTLYVVCYVAYESTSHIMAIGNIHIHTKHTMRNVFAEIHIREMLVIKRFSSGQHSALTWARTLPPPHTHTHAHAQAWHYIFILMEFASATTSAKSRPSSISRKVCRVPGAHTLFASHV